MMGSIQVSNLGKAYKQYPTRWARLAEWMFPFNGVKHQLKWVLRNIHFKIEPGEAGSRQVMFAILGKEFIDIPVLCCSFLYCRSLFFDK